MNHLRKKCKSKFRLTVYLLCIVAYMYRQNAVCIGRVIDKFDGTVIAMTVLLRGIVRKVFLI